MERRHARQVFPQEEEKGSVRRVQLGPSREKGSGEEKNKVKKLRRGSESHSPKQKKFRERREEGLELSLRQARSRPGKRGAMQREKKGKSSTKKKKRGTEVGIPCREYSNVQKSKRGGERRRI